MEADSTVPPRPTRTPLKINRVRSEDENFPKFRARARKKRFAPREAHCLLTETSDILQVVIGTCPPAAVPFSLAPPSGWAVVVFCTREEGERSSMPRQTALDCAISQAQLSPNSAPTGQHMLFLNYRLIWQTTNLEQRWGRTLAEPHFIQQGRHCHTNRWKQAEQARKATISSRWG